MFLGSEIHPHSPTMKYYKLVGNNIDKNVHPCYMRNDHQVRPLHYFHTYAVLDRVDLLGYRNYSSPPDLTTIQLNNLLPMAMDE